MKGISPLIAAVLLIAFTVAIATLIFGFLSSTIRATTASAENRTTEALECTAANVNIEDVFVTGTTTATVRIIVKNSGFTNNLVIQDLQVFNTTGNNFTSASLPIQDFDRGEITTVTVANASFSSCPGGFSKVLVTTSCGGISDEFDGTPKCA